MKKFFLLLVLMITTSVLAQQANVSPYFPDIAYSNSNRRDLTQWTYFDLNFVSLKVTSFIYNKMEMSQDGEQDIKFNNGIGTITQSYIEQASRGIPKKLKIKYTVFPIEHDFVIKSVKITGDYEKVTTLYAYYWNTSLHFDEVASKKIVTSQNLQDKVVYHYNGRNPYITVDNTTIHDSETFSKEFIVKRDKYNLNKEKRELEKKQQEQAEIEALNEQRNAKIAAYKAKEEKRQEEIKKLREKREEENKRIKSRRYSKTNIEVVKKKRKFDFNQEVDTSLEKKIETFLQSEKNGSYVLEVVRTYELDKEVDLSFNIIGYEKPILDKAVKKASGFLKGF